MFQEDVCSCLPLTTGQWCCRGRQLGAMQPTPVMRGLFWTETRLGSVRAMECGASQNPYVEVCSSYQSVIRASFYTHLYVFMHQFYYYIAILHIVKEQYIEKGFTRLKKDLHF